MVHFLALPAFFNRRSATALLAAVLLASNSRSTAASRTSDCLKAVSTTTSKKNSFCRDLCKAGKTSNSEFTSSCGFVDYWPDPPTSGIGSEECYQLHIYGYVINEWNRNAVGYAHHFNIATPQECQQLCQDDVSNCVNWVWTEGHRLGGPPNCVLKSQNHVDRSWLGSGGFNDAFCNPDTSRHCFVEKKFECLGTNTCIWCSDAWLSGPPHCQKLSDGKLFPGPEGTPICDGIPDLDVTTSPDPSKPTRPPTVVTYPTGSPVPGQSTTRPATRPPHSSTGPGGSGTTTTTTTTEAVPANPIPAILGATGGVVALAAAAAAGYWLSRETPPEIIEGEFEGADDMEVDSHDRDIAILADEGVFATS